IVNITSGSVKMPLAGLDLSSGARAGLTGFMAGIARSVASANVTINFLLPGAFATDRLESTITGGAARRGVSPDVVRTERMAAIPAQRFGDPEEFGAACEFLGWGRGVYFRGKTFWMVGGFFRGLFCPRTARTLPRRLGNLRRGACPPVRRNA